MDLQLVSYEQAKSLKELGFPQGWKCEKHYCLESEGDYGYQIGDTISANVVYKNALDAVSAPTLELAAKWLREKKDLHIEILYRKNHYVIDFREYDTYYVSNSNKVFQFSSYEEALSVGIDKAIEMLKNKYI